MPLFPTGSSGIFMSVRAGSAGALGRRGLQFIGADKAVLVGIDIAHAQREVAPGIGGADAPVGVFLPERQIALLETAADMGIERDRGLRDPGRQVPAPR